MTDKIKMPFNDVFFYGLSLNSRDVTDVRTDIFANILMRYLRTLKPVSSKLYRIADGNRYEYSYSFIPTKPLSWRVIKNRRIVEEIEQLSDGKYCLNYYDDQGRDVKRVLFSKQHKWQKTNYYNSISGSQLLCSIVPKEKNGETVLLQYITGETYPVTLYCCPVASCQEVLHSVLDRVPAPEAMALTNYGVLYFAQEEILNIFKQVLSDEEEKYALLHKPEVFTTEEDVASGFCFEVSSFDSTKPIGSMFDLSEAQELSDDNADMSASEAAEVYTDAVSESETVIVEAPVYSEAATDAALSDKDVYSLDADISEAIKLISDATAVHIDEEVVFGETAEESSASDFFTEATSDTPVVEADDSAVGESLELIVEPVADMVQETSPADNLDSFVIFDDIPSTAKIDSEAADALLHTEDTVSVKVPIESTDDVDLLSMNDEDIDDYVQTLIDSLLLDAKSVSELKDSVDNAFTAGADEAVVEDTDSAFKTVQDLITDTSADAVIESNGAEYFYYGSTDDKGRRSGRGKTLMSDGKTAYEGDYKDDKRHGTGSFYYKDGSLCYYGEWQENLRDGFGVGISSETGTVHIGTWCQNKPTGIGVRFDKDGRFMYVDSASHRTNGGIRVTGFTDTSLIIEYWDETTLRTVKKEISLDDLFK